ncbi:ankyrin repeat and SOCS box protein 17 [Caerostris darwini]|uniref:Ankyrin repeat and SOCS box protein 17 n=1 Tax=Caerostris darwini TaxID=1538125 RepID=A0AAV4VIA0_9ARAC|nr:ankyrin repeat and SOCS box protein 17 [Caerostris darwini]
MIVSEKLEAEEAMTKLYSTAKRFSQRYISPLVLRQIYRLYCKWRGLVRNRNGWWDSRKDERRIYAFDSCILHYLLERCFWVHYGDNKVVAHLLAILFELDGHLGKIFDFSLLSSGRKHWRTKYHDHEQGRNTMLKLSAEDFFMESTWKNEALDAELVKPLDYFLEHAYKRRVLFNNKRFAEQFIVHSIKTILGRRFSLLCHPCAMSFKCPEILPKLLRHGLFVNAGPKDENVGKLITGIIGIYATSGLEAIPLQILEMGNVLLRAVKSVDPDVLMKCQRIRNRTPLVQKLLTNVVETDVLPKLRIRCGGPQELQHICRCVIRKCLYESWQLPTGICFLPLPTLMKEYINLKLD